MKLEQFVDTYVHFWESNVNHISSISKNKLRSYESKSYT